MISGVTITFPVASGAVVLGSAVRAAEIAAPVAFGVVLAPFPVPSSGGYLLDDNGNFLTDENGNRLTI